MVLIGPGCEFTNLGDGLGAFIGWLGGFGDWLCTFGGGLVSFGEGTGDCTGEMDIFGEELGCLITGNTNLGEALGILGGAEGFLTP